MKLSKQVLDLRVFKQELLDLHASEFLLSHVHKYIDHSKQAIDVGAATGMYSFHFSHYANHVHSFEAVPEVYTQLIKVCKWRSNVSTYNYAVSDFKGKHSFFVDDKRLSNSGLQNLVGGYEIEVDVIRLDDMQFENIGFIKIDTEGTELDVLHGADQLIESQQPTCMIEIYEKFNKYPIRTSFEYFSDKGYQCVCNIRGEGLLTIESVDHGEDVASDPKLLALHDGDFLFYGDLS